MTQPSLFDLLREGEAPPPDQAARDFATNPANDVVLEASAGTGKTRVLVDRYVRIIERGVDPRHILAMTFTRKAAAEMRDRVLAALRRRAAEGAFAPPEWRRLRDRIADIQITTIDAFCFGLLREFPLEADVDPTFEIADETEMARFANEALDLTLRAARGLVTHDEHVRLLFARVKAPVLRDAVSTLLDRRHVAGPAIASFVERQHGPDSADGAAAAFVAALRGALRDLGPGTVSALTDDGPHGAPEFRWVHADLVAMAAPAGETGAVFDDPARVQQLRRRLHRYFLTKSGDPRQKVTKPFTADRFASPAARQRHEAAVKSFSPTVLGALDRLNVHVTGLLARGLLRVFAIAVDKYETLLGEHSLLDFAGMLARSVVLLERQEEFARSRLKLQARYHHVLVDEFQDTSRLQWRLVELLIDAWGEGEGAADSPTSIFVVGDRKQSIYRFRHAEVTLLDEAARKIGGLRAGRPVRQAISASFRAVPELLAFVNALSERLQGDPELDDRFDYREADRFPVPLVSAGALRDGRPVLGLVAEPSMAACASAVADEIARLLAGQLVRDRTGPLRPARPEDVAILFRARAGHQYFEAALAARGIRSYVYKGLGFFDAPEVQDLQALLRCLAQPDSNLRAAELLRSRIVRISDRGLVQLAPDFSRALVAPDFAPVPLDDLDRSLLTRARTGVSRWLAVADRLPPSELLDLVLRESSYAFEMRGRRMDQARENVKKVRAMVRRVESRGYATLDRLAAYFETLRAGDESNAILEESGAVNLMTMHAAKGLEFPIVFLVNLHAAGRGRPAGFSVIDRGVGGLSEVAFDSTDSTRLEDRREQEELRRVLYVAVTRARDRLYLAAETDDKGRLKRGARSIGGLLPPGIADLFAIAAGPAQPDRVTWTQATGSFVFDVCRPAAVSAESGVTLPGPTSEAAVPDLGAITSRHRRLVATADQAGQWSPDPARATTSGSDRLVGTVVHRMLARNLDVATDAGRLSELARDLTRPDELVDVPDSARLGSRAADLYLALRQRDDVTVLLASGDCHYEVPFSYEPPDRPGSVIRGVVDCLIAGNDGRLTLLEFKTGQPNPEHQAQVAVYAEAISAALGAANISVRILYA
jgi:ATP-dependent helicase/nuclease subunit A